jgi:zona occludens toxin
MGGQRIFDLRLVDLERSGYTFEPMGECAGMLRWKTKAVPVTCDAPVLAQGSQNVPVVIDSATGRSSVPRPAPAPVEPVDLSPG